MKENNKFYDPSIPPQQLLLPATTLAKTVTTMTAEAAGKATNGLSNVQGQCL